MKLYEQTRTQAGAILGNLQGLVAAREAQAVDHCRQRAAAPGAGRPAGQALGSETGLGAGRC